MSIFSLFLQFVTMKRIHKALLLLLACAAIVKPQAQIFTYKGNPVSAEEFKRQFLKNHNEDEKITEAAIKEYLEMYINYKLKVQDAMDAGLDTMPEYKQELKMYRDQLARGYLYDREVSEALIVEGYQRKKEEVNCSHILVLLPPNPSPADTLKYYNRIKRMYDSVMSGKSTFEEMARHSDDVSNAYNGGNLGYFTAFQLVYPFENAAYNTLTGNVSPIFRTQFGYHFVKIIARRPYRGDIHLRRLFLKTGVKGLEDDNAKKARIEEIYNDINSGKTSFIEAVRNYSQDYNTRNSGGDMDFLSSTHFVGDPDKTKILDIGFSLKSPGIISQPFKTMDGWNIIQLVEVKALPPFDQIKLGIKNQVQEDSRSLKSREAMIEKEKVEDNYVFFPGSLKSLEQCLDTNFLNGVFDETKLPVYAPADKKASDPKKGKNPFITDAAPIPLRQLNLMQLGDETYTVGDFAKYLSRAAHKSNNNLTGTLHDYYQDWSNYKVVEYRDRHLAEKSADFANIYQEYREGILLFNRMQQEVWDKSNTDSVGLEKYHASIKDSFRWDNRYYIAVYYCDSQKTMNELYKMHGKLKRLTETKRNDSLTKYFAKKGITKLSILTGKYELADTASFTNPDILKTIFANPKNIYQNPKSRNKLMKLNNLHNQWILVKVYDYLPAGAKMLDETRGPAVSKYQDYLQTEWVNNLRKKYPVQINNTELNNVIKNLSAH